MIKIIFIISLITSCFVYSQSVDDSIVEMIETGIKVGNIQDCGTGGFSEQELIDANHQMSYAEAELRELIKEAKECSEQSRIFKIDIRDRCRDEIKNLNDRFFALKKFNKKKKISLGCSTKNDNSPMYYITKSNKDRGTDEGATASHQCFLEYSTKKGKIVLRLENSLFTEFVDVWQSDNDVDNDGKPDLEMGQRALERTKLEILYEWVEKPGLKIAIGPYISQQIRGESFATRLQENWHESNETNLYREQTPDEDRGKKYGAGVTLEVEKSILQKQKPFYEVNSKIFSGTDIGYEANDWLIDQKLGTNLTGRVYSSRYNSGAYFGGGGEIEIDHTTLGKNSNTALWQRFRLETGYKGKNWEVGAYASHAYNMFYDGPGFDDDGKRTSLFHRDDGQDNITTKSKRQFELGFKASASLNKSRSQKNRDRVREMEINHLEILIESLEQDIDTMIEKQNVDLVILVRKKNRLKKLTRELARLKLK